MARASVELRPRRRPVDTRPVGSGPRSYLHAVPPASVVFASALAALPIITQNGWAPDFGFLVLITWRLLRPDVWPAWWGVPLGLANDLLTGSPIGLSVAIWTTAMLILDLLEQRMLWRDYWVEWVLVALLATGNEAAHWKIDALMGAPLPFSAAAPQIIMVTLFFPFAARWCSALDRWRLGH